MEKVLKFPSTLCVSVRRCVSRCDVMRSVSHGARRNHWGRLRGPGHRRVPAPQGVVMLCFFIINIEIDE